jgi:hypothetical protein
LANTRITGLEVVDMSDRRIFNEYVALNHDDQVQKWGTSAVAIVILLLFAYALIFYAAQTHNQKGALQGNAPGDYRIALEATPQPSK